MIVLRQTYLFNTKMWRRCSFRSLTTTAPPAVSQAALNKPFERLQREWQHPSSVRQFIHEKRGIKKHTCWLYQIGSESVRFRVSGDDDISSEYQAFDCITFPFIHRDETSNETHVRRYKARAVADKSHIRSIPLGVNTHSYFGWHTIPIDYKGAICITEGEIDAMTVYQEIGIPAISIPNGAGSFPPALVDCLERFDRVYLWFDNDDAGVNGSLAAWRKIIERFGLEKCDMVRTPQGFPKDANDLYLQNYNLKDILSKHLFNVPLVSFKQHCSRVVNMNQEMLVPISNKFPQLAELLGGGWRMGDMSIVTGRREDVLRLTSAICAEKDTLFVSEALRWKEEVEEKNGEFRHMVVDDLERLVIGVDQDAMTDFAKHEAMVNAVLDMQRFAWKHQVHITLVAPIVQSAAAHARNLQLEHIKGSVETSQIVDLVLVAQQNRRNELCAVDVQKNRFTGRLGSVALEFNTEQLQEQI